MLETGLTRRTCKRKEHMQGCYSLYQEGSGEEESEVYRSGGSVAERVLCYKWLSPTRFKIRNQTFF